MFPSLKMYIEMLLVWCVVSSSLVCILPPFTENVLRHPKSSSRTCTYLSLENDFYPQMNISTCIYKITISFLPGGIFQSHCGHFRVFPIYQIDSHLTRSRSHFFHTMDVNSLFIHVKPQLGQLISQSLHSFARKTPSP